MKMTIMRRYVLILFLLMISQHLLANAGSSMLWFSFLHLIVINAFIGFAESKILKGLQIENKMGWIIAGNYISMLIGMYFIVPYLTSKFGYNDFFGNLTNLGSYDLNGFFIGMLIAFISTLIIEYPFYYFGIIKNKRSKMMEGLIIANLITNFIMTIIYFSIVKGYGHF